MSKITAEAIKVVTYLQEQNSHLKNNTGTIYIPTEDITTLENLLIHSHKQEKLLERLVHRDTPMKVKNKQHGICPNCEQNFSFMHIKYCFECGQKLDWEIKRGGCKND